MSKLALRAQTVDIADLPLRQDLLAKNVLMTAQRNCCLGNNLLTLDKQQIPTELETHASAHYPRIHLWMGANVTLEEKKT